MAAPSPTLASPPEAIITFFLLMNKSGRDVKVRVSVDNRLLFVQEIRSEQEGSVGAEEVPPPGRYPARELKVPLKRTVKCLTVEEVRSGLKAVFDVANFGKDDAGFRIIIGDDGIRLAQDYFPIR